MDIKSVFYCVFFLLMCGCQSLESALVEPITLPNGSRGLTIDCTSYGWTTCFKAAGEKCPSGYAIHERSMQQNTTSELAIEPLSTGEETQLRDHTPLIHGREDKYMVISCK
jgi:hypothetical protein